MGFSVLMSIYKDDNPVHLKTALESIYEGQSLKPDQIVLVFDGPLKDEHYLTVDSFAKDKADIVKIVKLDKNMGLGDALRIGSSYCDFEYIMRMDSDDISVPQRFEKQMAYIEEHPEIDCVGAYISEFESDPKIIMRIRKVPESSREIAAMVTRRNPMNHMTVCMKKASLMKCGGYENLLLLEDYLLWLKMITDGQLLANIPECLVKARTDKAFNRKRGSKVRIKGWQRLQEYMLNHKMINKRQARENMICIRLFVNSPEWMKTIIYNYVLREKSA